MQIGSQMVAVLISLMMVTVVLRLTYRQKLREEHSLLWLFAAGAILGLSVFQGLVATMARLLGISYPPSLLFSVAAVFAVSIELSHAVAITSLMNKNRDLAQGLAILEWRLQRLQEETRDATASGISLSDDLVVPQFLVGNPTDHHTRRLRAEARRVQMAGLAGERDRQGVE